MVVFNFDKGSEVYPYGILGRASTVVEENDGHWINGFDYVITECAPDVTVGSVCDPSLEEVTILDGSGLTALKYLPFNVSTVFTCSTLGMRIDEVSDIAKKSSKAKIQFAIEREIFNGALSIQLTQDNSNRSLLNDSTVDPTTFADPVEALAAAEDAVTRVTPGFTGTIHAHPVIASFWELKEDDKGVLRTRLGTKVIVGQGYSDPDETTTSAIFVTGDIKVILGETSLRAGLDGKTTVTVSNNSIEAFTDTPAAVLWDSCESVQINVTIPQP